jgi:hypothetical protein
MSTGAAAPANGGQLKMEAARSPKLMNEKMCLISARVSLKRYITSPFLRPANQGKSRGTREALDEEMST